MQGESCLLDTEVPELERVDQALGEKAEQLRMAANRSAAKAKATLRRMASEDGSSCASSQASPKGEKEKNLPLRLGLWPLSEEEAKARDKLASGPKERPRPDLMEEERLFLQDLTEEQEEMIRVLDAEKAQREREEREADRELQQLRAASKKMAPPSSSWTPPGGRPQSSHPHGGQDGTGVVDQARNMAILKVFTKLADRFDQPARPAPPTVPRFTDSYPNWP